MKQLVWLLFLPGFLCHQNPLTIHPNSLVTWEGSCVLIPCEIGQYYGTNLQQISLVWYFQPYYDSNQMEYKGVLLYNSSSGSYPKKQSTSVTQGQVTFLGDLSGYNLKKNCSLKISNVRIQDNGIYGARLHGSSSRNQQKWYLSATVHVAESPPAPTIDISPKSIGESWVTVTCSVRHHCPDEPLRLMFTDLEERRLSAQRMTVNNGVIQTVVGFQVTWQDHRKNLFCSLEREDGSEISRSTMQLDVNYAPKDVRLTIETPQLLIKEEDTARLNCSFSHSNPRTGIEYKWYKNKSLMSKEGNLWIFTAKLEDTGDYRCEACNTVNCISSPSVVVNIHFAPKEVKVVPNPGTQIYEGKQVNLACTVVKANPRVSSYRWFKDGELQQSDPTSADLTFSTVTPAHSGRYWCEATNSVATSRSQGIMLNVYYAPKGVQLRALPGTTLQEGQTLSLECAVKSSNPEVDEYCWYKDLQLMSGCQNQSKIEFEAKGDQHSGVYTCEAKNSVGSQKSEELRIDVQPRSQDTSTHSASEPKPTAPDENPQTSPPPPATLLPSTCLPPYQSELFPSHIPTSPLPSSQTPCDGRTLWEELCSLRKWQAQAVEHQKLLLSAYKELTSAVVELTEQLRKAESNKEPAAENLHAPA